MAPRTAARKRLRESQCSGDNGDGGGIAIRPSSSTSTTLLLPMQRAAAAPGDPRSEAHGGPRQSLFCARSEKYK